MLDLCNVAVSVKALESIDVETLQANLTGSQAVVWEPISRNKGSQLNCDPLLLRLPFNKSYDCLY
jgi:hypothetical protein